MMRMRQDIFTLKILKNGLQIGIIQRELLRNSSDGFVKRTERSL